MTPPSPVRTATPPIMQLSGDTPEIPIRQISLDDELGGDHFSDGKPSTSDSTGASVHPLFGKFDPNKVDLDKANKFRESGDKLMQMKNFKKAEEAYTKALAANPNDKESTLKLAEAMVAGKDPMAPLNVYSLLTFFIESHPQDAEVRSMRMKLSGEILKGLENNFKDIPEAELQEFQSIVSSLLLNSKIDEAVLMAGSSKNFLEQLKADEEKLGKMHGAPVERKLKVIFASIESIKEMSSLSALPFPDEATAELVQNKLPMLAAETFGVLARFAKDDSEGVIQKMAPLLEAYQLLGLGKEAEARPFLEIVRSQGYQEIGGGDEEMGRIKFQKNYSEAKKLEDEIQQIGAKATQMMEAGKRDEAVQEAQKARSKMEAAHQLIGNLPQGFLDAFLILEKYEAQSLMQANLKVIAEWKNQIQRQSPSDDLTGPWREIQLVLEIEKKLQRGDADTIQEALAHLKEKGATEELKASAKARIEKTSDLIYPLIAYTASSNPHPTLQIALMSVARVMHTYEKKQAASIYSVLSEFGSNESLRKEAKAAIAEKGS